MKNASEPVIEMHQLVKGFGTATNRVRAVNGIDLSIAAGEIVALLGPNGAGKTTTIDMLLGLSEPDEGHVRVLGLTPREAVVAGRLSALLQTGGLLADLTVRETVSVIAGFHGVSDRIEQIMQRTELTPLAKRRVGKCSGGEQQRVKFALALLSHPEVLVLDEPTTGMDVNARRRFWEVMREEARSGRTIVFATHYLEEAEQFAERTIVIDRGSVVADAETAQLRASLGGRVVSATLPPNECAMILAQLELIERLKSPADDAPDFDFAFDVETSRVRLRSTDSDATAAKLLELGAYDLEIAAPTLESAFSSLTEN